MDTLKEVRKRLEKWIKPIYIIMKITNLVFIYIIMIY
jgi:hypothetical protein